MTIFRRFWNSRFIRGASPTIEFAGHVGKNVWRWCTRYIRPLKTYRKRLNHDVIREYHQQMAMARQLDLPRTRGSIMRRSITRAELRLAFATVMRTRVERTVFVALCLIVLSSMSVNGTALVDKGGHAGWLVMDPFDYVFHLVEDDAQHLFASRSERSQTALQKGSANRPPITNAVILQPEFSATLLVLVLMGFFFSRSRRSARWPMFGAGVVGVALVLTLILRSANPTEWSDLARSGIAWAAVLVAIAVLLFAVDVLGSGLAYGFMHWRRRMYPDAIVLDGLLKVLHRVTQSPERWPDLSFRRELAGRIEEVALALQFGFPGRLRVGNPVVNSWISRMTTEQAAAIRELQKWLLHPKSDTREHFVARIRETLELCACGNWDALERREPEKLTPRQRGQRLVGALATLIGAFVPIGVLLLTSRLLGGDKVPDFLYIFAMVWSSARHHPSTRRRSLDGMATAASTLSTARCAEPRSCAAAAGSWSSTLLAISVTAARSSCTSLSSSPSMNCISSSVSGRSSAISSFTSMVRSS
jgi:hypothetical protein